VAAAIAGIDLQHILRRLSGCVVRARIGCAGLHGRDVHDNEVTGDEYHVERYQGIFHPEALGFLLSEDEEHTAVLSKRAPVHQAPHLISRLRDNFYLNSMITRG
jgi:hypothetical protein